jgi:peptidoglycan-associated lipoprotein
MGTKTKEAQMSKRKTIVFGFIVISVLVALAGCSSTADKPEASSTAAATGPVEAKKQPASAPTDQTSSSSLDALKRGESTATPESSPLKDVYFDFDKFDLRADARETLKANWAWLKANPSAQVQLEGHCDERGTTEYNLALGSKRAQSVKDYLVTLGATADRLSTISYGEELPVCREQTEECWQKNRRARFVIQPAKPAA